MATTLVLHMWETHATATGLVYPLCDPGVIRRRADFRRGDGADGAPTTYCPDCLKRNGGL